MSRSIIIVDCPVTVVENVIMLIFVSDYVTEVMEIPREQKLPLLSLSQKV